MREDLPATVCSIDGTKFGVRLADALAPGNCEREWDHISPTTCGGKEGESVCCYSDLRIPRASERAGPSLFFKDSWPRSWTRLKVLGHRSKEALGSKETWDYQIQSIGRWSSLSMNLKYSGNCLSLNKHFPSTGRQPGCTHQVLLTLPLSVVQDGSRQDRRGEGNFSSFRLSLTSSGCLGPSSPPLHKQMAHTSAHRTIFSLRLKAHNAGLSDCAANCWPF